MRSCYPRDADLNPSTSPSVYVAYTNLGASTDCHVFGKEFPVITYNTTIAYKPEDLSTSYCLHWGSWAAINYTQLQYNPPLPASVIDGCPGYGPDQDEENPPMYFSFPSNVAKLKSSWKGCTLSMFGAFDPPTTLNKATAMAPEASPSHATPGATMRPQQPSATPTPRTKDPIIATAQPASQVKNPSTPSKIPQTSESYSPTQDPNGIEPSVVRSVLVDSKFNRPLVSSDPIGSDPTSINDSPVSIKSGSIVGKPLPVSSLDGAPTKGSNDNAYSLTASGASSSLQTPGIGGVIVGAIGFSSDSLVSSVTNAADKDIDGMHKPSTQVASSVLDDKTLTLGEPEMTIAGLPLSLLQPESSHTEAKADRPSPPSSMPEYSLPSQASATTPIEIAVAGSTIQKGGPAVTIAGNRVSLQSSGGLIIGEHTLPVSAINLQTPTMTAISATPVYTVGGQTFEANPSAISVAGTVLSAGGSGIVVAGTSINLQSSGDLIVQGSTIAMPTASPGSESPSVTDPVSAYTVGGEVLSANPTAISVAGFVVTAGGPGIAIAATSVSLEASGSLIVGPSTLALPAQESITVSIQPLPYTVGNAIVSGNPMVISLAGSTLAPGDAGVTILGTYVSLESSGSVVIRDSTISLPAAEPTSTASAPVYTINDEILSANPTAISIAASSSLIAGSPGVEVGGNLVSLGKPGDLVIGASTVPATPTAKSYTPAGDNAPNTKTTAVPVSETSIVSDEAELTIGGTLISVQASGETPSGSSGGPSTQATHTAAHSSAAKATIAVSLSIAFAFTAFFLEI